MIFAFRTANGVRLHGPGKMIEVPWWPCPDEDLPSAPAWWREALIEASTDEVHRILAVNALGVK